MYLDIKGLLAVWREGLLAKKVLIGETAAYINHPQLIRFKKYHEPIVAINAYLYQIFLECVHRGYNFNSDKILVVNLAGIIEVTEGQVIYEYNHLLHKLKSRDPAKYISLQKIKIPEINQIFRVVPGDVEPWEKQKINS